MQEETDVRIVQLIIAISTKFTELILIFEG